MHIDNDSAISLLSVISVVRVCCDLNHMIFIGMSIGRAQSLKGFRHHSRTMVQPSHSNLHSLQFPQTARG